MEIIPAIDLLDGRCVRLFQGDFSKVTDYDADPVALAQTYAAAGLKRLHLVDLDGARTGVPGNLPIIKRIASADGLAIQVGGGVRNRAMAEALLDAGVQKVVVGSVAIDHPNDVLGWLRSAGDDRFILAFDVKIHAGTGAPEAVTHGWKKASGKGLWQLLDTFTAAGARNFLCTDVGRDGTLAGPNNSLYEECVRRYPGGRFIASGGLAGVQDLTALAATGVTAVVTGKALLDGRLTLSEIAQFSRAV